MLISSFFGVRSLAGVDLRGFELPPLSVVCGVNGTGKSHLLESLQNRTTQLEAPRGTQRRTLIRPRDLTMPNDNVRHDLLTAEQRYDRFLAIAELAEHGNLEEVPDQTPEGRLAFRVKTADESGVLRLDALEFMQRMTGKVDLSFTLDDFVDFGPALGDFDPFTISLTSLFYSYRRAQHDNVFKQFLVQHGGPPALSSDQFFALHGAEPWKLVQEFLDSFDIPLTVAPPPDQWFPDDGLENYSASLTTSGGATISADELSSGEQVLLRLIGRIFENRLDFAPRLPDVLLLDEIDSVLHPSLSSRLMDVLRTTLVERHGVNVVLTTHSPVTAVGAPADSLLEMRRSGKRVRRISQERAIQSLTTGLPTLAVRVENTRQVFVESIYDQAVHQELYDVLKSKIDSEMALAFVPAGDRKIAGGKKRVRDLVGDLQRNGVSSARGLIDKDERSSAPPFIEYVDGRYALENIVLDPLQIGVFLLRERWKQPSFFGLAPDVSERNLNKDDAQKIVDVIAQKLNYSGSQAEVNYCGGFTLKVPEMVLTKRGKDLADDLFRAIPELAKLKGDKSYLWKIVNKVSRDTPDYVPSVVLSAYRRLLSSNQ